MAKDFTSDGSIARGTQRRLFSAPASRLAAVTLGALAIWAKFGTFSSGLFPRLISPTGIKGLADTYIVIALFRGNDVYSR